MQVLEKFLTEKDRKVAEESQWLRSIKADCVLSDAAFLGWYVPVMRAHCVYAHGWTFSLAANEVGIPSILITNFSFDSVYSYLSTPFIDKVPEPDPISDALHPHHKPQEELEPDVPIPLDELAPLVKQIHEGYRCADLLLRLPGAIPLPSFALQPSLPSPEWVDIQTRTFKPFVVDHLTQPPSTYELQPQIPFPPSYPPKPLRREVRAAPLLVRSTDPAVYTPEGRSRLLSSIGVPPRLHDPERTKILIVSFGGQVFHKPHSRSHSRTPSKSATPIGVPSGVKDSPNTVTPPADHPKPLGDTQDSAVDPGQHAQALSDALQNAKLIRPDTPPEPVLQEQKPVRALPAHLTLETDHPHTRPRGLSQLRVAGAPPAAVPTSPRIPSQMPAFVTIPPTPLLLDGFDAPDYSWGLAGAGGATEVEAEVEPRILPDASWIAIVCGVPKDWGREDGEELPDNFFVAPRDVYMPDLTAVADVLLGKLVRIPLPSLFVCARRVADDEDPCVGLRHGVGVRRRVHAVRVRPAAAVHRGARPAPLPLARGRRRRARARAVRAGRVGGRGRRRVACWKGGEGEEAPRGRDGAEEEGGRGDGAGRRGVGREVEGGRGCGCGRGGARERVRRCVVLGHRTKGTWTSPELFYRRVYVQICVPDACSCCENIRKTCTMQHIIWLQLSTLR